MVNFWKTLRRDTVERWRRWRTDSSLPVSLWEHEDGSLVLPASLDTLSSLSELSSELESLPCRLHMFFKSWSELGVVIISVISSTGGIIRILGFVDFRWGSIFDLSYSFTAFTGKSSMNEVSLVTKFIIWIFRNLFDDNFYCFVIVSLNQSVRFTSPRWVANCDMNSHPKALYIIFSAWAVAGLLQSEYKGQCSKFWSGDVGIWNACIICVFMFIIFLCNCISWIKECEQR